MCAWLGLILLCHAVLCCALLYCAAQHFAVQALAAGQPTRLGSVKRARSARAVLCYAVLYADWPAAESACSMRLSCASRGQLPLRCWHPAHPVNIELLWVLPWVGNIPHYQLPTVPSTTQQVLAIKAQTTCAHAALLQGPCFAAVGEVI